MSIQEDNVQFVGVSNVETANLALTEEDFAEDSLDSPVENVSGISWYAAIFLVVNAALGAGLLDFPQAFGQAGGVLVAVIVQLVLIVFVILALVILAYCSEAHISSTYQEVVKSICGKYTHAVCTLCIVLYCFGTCITFVIIIGDQFDRVFASMYGNQFCHYWYMNRAFVTCVSCLIFILPLCFPKKIDFLTYASYFGVLSILYVEFVIIYKFYEGKVKPGHVSNKPQEWTDIFLVVPVICFGYQCHVSCVPVYSCLKDRRVAVFLRTVLSAICICAFTYTVAATYGYLTFGSNVSSDILYTYDAADPIVLVGIIALALKTYMTYPILLFCGRAAVEDLYLGARGWEADTPVAERTEPVRRVIIAVVWFGASLFLALVVPNIGVVIQLLGSLAAIFIFIFPGLCLLKLCLLKDPYFVSRSSKGLVLLSCVFLVLGTFIFGQAASQALYSDIRKDHQGTVLNLCV